MKTMFRDYADIKSRLGEPLWYDSNGVPRYDPFNPKLCGISARIVSFNEITCQACGKPFKVAVEVSSSDSFPKELPSDPEALGELLHYGDPPRHDCRVGDTMNSVPRRILEFWVRPGFVGKVTKERSEEFKKGWSWSQREEMAGLDIT